MALLLLIAALLGAQGQAAPDPVLPQRPADERPANDVVLYPGAVEAPRQPEGRSDSLVVRTPRIEPVAAKGTSGHVMVRVGDLVSVRGQEENVVQGIGLVMGLSGTGDTANAARQALLNVLQTQNVRLTLQDITSANIAVVMIEATLPPGIKPGQKIDVRVSSIYDCASLVGGTLLHTELKNMTGDVVFATASGAVSTGAFSAEADGASARRNHLTVGTIPLGGKVQREVPTRIVSENGTIYLDLKALKGSFANAARIAESINAIYPTAAMAQDAMTVSVRVPGDLPGNATVAYVSSLLEREIVPEPFARVVINERTGVIVMGEGVRITRGAITKGNLTVTIAETPEVSQPGPLSEGRTVELPRSTLLLEEEDRALTIVNGAVTLQEVVEVLNVLGVTPRDMIQILQSMAQSGMLHADIVVM
jgi:flagellar P-ring protein precursor FlgI